jgi:hypothetical protein
VAILDQILEYPNAIPERVYVTSHPFGKYGIVDENKRVPVLYCIVPHEPPAEEVQEPEVYKNHAGKISSNTDQLALPGHALPTSKVNVIGDDGANVDGDTVLRIVKSTQVKL